MKVVFVMFDSLNRKALGCYGGERIATPNFDRLAARGITFDRHYACSLPCMPARRDLMTGRPSFLHRSWGPLEPFDNVLPELLHAKGVYSHLATDHSHYWEDGGATYHTRFDSFDLIRGQENDPWIARVDPPLDELRAQTHPKQFRPERRTKFFRYMINRTAIREEKEFPSVKCFDAGIDFLEHNHAADDWFLQIETFDPHEPFHAPEHYREPYPTGYRGPTFDWPPYARVSETPDEADEIRANYAATVALCDAQLGRLLDSFDRLDLWKDTALVLTTDHGFMLGEHDWWAKIMMPCYQEIAHIPLIVHHPGLADQAGTRRSALTSTIDLMPTFCELFGVEIPKEVTGRSILPALRDDSAVREVAVWGVFGSAINATDGSWTCFHYPPDIHGGDLFQYTLMPSHMTRPFTTEELAEAELVPPLSFTKGVPVLRIPTRPKSPYWQRHGPAVQNDTDTVLYDIEADPGQLHPLDAPAEMARMQKLIQSAMHEMDAPPEAYRRFGLDPRPRG